VCQVARKGKLRIGSLRPPKRGNKQYWAKAKADYKAKKAGERKVKKAVSVAPVGEVKHTVWAEAHKGVEQNVVNTGQEDKECTGYMMKNNPWKYYRKPVYVSVVYREPAKPKRQA